MTLPPIVDRELRVAARKRATYGWRLATVLVACVVGAVVMSIAGLSGGAIGSQMGALLFGGLKWPGFVFACIAGIFLTSDCMSEEKREGTLGLLFLTDLRGYDVVLGKLTSNSLRAFYGLLAVFPVMALAFILGGVAQHEFWHVVLLLCNTLFLSLTAGMAVSSISRESQKAMNGTLLVLLILVLIFPAMERGLADWRGVTYQPWLALLSPTVALNEAASYRSGEYWLSMAWVNALGWAFLGVASWFTPRNWQSGNSRPTMEKRGRISFFSPARMTDARRQRMLDINPLSWLISRDRWLFWLARVTVILALLFSVIGLLLGKQGVMFTYIGSYGAWLLTVIFELWVAAHVSRFYVEGRESGFLQLLLTTPLEPIEIVRGHWQALRRLFLWPVITLLILRGVTSSIQIAATYRSLPPAVPGGAGMAGTLLTAQIVSLVTGSARFVTGLLVMGWFAMWMGLTSKKTNVAVVKTVFFGRLVPMFVVGAVVGFGTVFLAMGARAFGGLSITWLLPLGYGVLGVAADVGLIFMARGKIQEGLRAFVSQPEPAMAYQPPNVPPVIGAGTPPPLVSIGG